ncbi:MAG: DsbA family protein [Lentisphaerales bacterium]|nr:DsbA family protein [Lentisphaerales bacterium]
MKEIEIFYDIISPYAYLGLKLFSKHKISQEVQFTITPVSLGSILGSTGNPGPANITPKRKVALYDFCLQCIKHDIPALGPPKHPFNPMPATRFISCIEDHELRFKAALFINKCCWADGLAVDTEEALTDLLKKTDFFQNEWEDIYAFTKANGGRKKMKMATNRALELDIFGVPTFRYDNVNFWGSDRLELLEDYIENPDKYQNTNYQKMLNTPSGM